MKWNHCFAHFLYSFLDCPLTPPLGTSAYSIPKSELGSEICRPKSPHICRTVCSWSTVRICLDRIAWAGNTANVAGRSPWPITVEGFRSLHVTQWWTGKGQAKCGKVDGFMSCAWWNWTSQSEPDSCASGHQRHLVTFHPGFSNA